MQRSLACVLLLVVAACGGSGGDDAGGDRATASVSIASPEDGATVPATFPVTMEAEGIAIEAAGDATDGADHFHLIVDHGCLPAGEEIPADETHVHLADGAFATELSLSAGEHTLCLQAGDGQHAALGLTDEITVTVAEGGETTTETATDTPSPERWEGTYAGTVTWDCGPLGMHTGELEGTVVVEAGEDGVAVMEGDNTVRGSCADTGELTTPISVTGERTAWGFTFPAALWLIPGDFSLQVTDNRATGELQGDTPEPAVVAIAFELTCTSGC